jgi:hypothetical protein
MSLAVDFVLRHNIGHRNKTLDYSVISFVMRTLLLCNTVPIFSTNVHTGVVHISMVVVLVCKQLLMRITPNSTLKTVRFTSLIICKTRRCRPRIVLHV